MLLTGGSELYHQHHKKTDKVLSRIWEDQVIEINPQNSNGMISGELHTVVNLESELLGYLIFNTAPSKVDFFTYLTVFSTEGSIIQVSILEYRENYGGEIASKRFLKQYIGKKAEHNTKFSDKIAGISGATLSVNSLNHALQKDTRELITYLNTLN